MAALTEDRKTEYQEGELLSLPVAASAAIYAGAMVCINTDGYACPAADTAGYRFVGVSTEAADNSSGADGDLNVEVRTKGVFKFATLSSAQAKVGQVMYVSNDQTFRHQSANRVTCGRLVQYDSATVGWIQIDAGLHQGQATIPIPLGALTLEDGTAITKFADGASATPGFSQESSKEVVLRWNDHATPTKVAFSVALPQDLDPNNDIEVHWLAKASGATDTPVLEHEVYIGAGDTDCAGTDDEIDGGTTLTEYYALVDDANVETPPNMVTVVFGPKAGELGNDDLLIYAVWIEYQRRAESV